MLRKGIRRPTRHKIWRPRVLLARLLQMLVFCPVAVTVDNISGVDTIRDVVTTVDFISHSVVRFKTTSRLVGVAISQVATIQGNVLSIAGVITSVDLDLVMVTVVGTLSALPVRVLYTVRHRVHRYLTRKKM